MAIKIARYGWKPDRPDKRDLVYSAPRALVKSLPLVIDHRKYFPACFDQLQAGACTGESTKGHLMYRQFVDHIVGPIEPSALFIYYNGRLIEGTQDQDAGASIRDVIKGVAQYGFCSEQCMPYSDVPRFVVKKPNKACYVDAAKRQIKNYMRLNQNLNVIKARIADGGAVSFGFSVYDSFEGPEIAKTGVMPMPEPGESILGGHAVVIAGYDSVKKMFIVRNSWGPGWGDHGYFYMPEDFLIDPNYCNDFWTIFMNPGAV